MVRAADRSNALLPPNVEPFVSTNQALPALVRALSPTSAAQTFYIFLVLLIFNSYFYFLFLILQDIPDNSPTGVTVTFTVDRAFSVEVNRHHPPCVVWCVRVSCVV